MSTPSSTLRRATARGLLVAVTLAVPACLQPTSGLLDETDLLGIGTPPGGEDGGGDGGAEPDGAAGGDVAIDVLEPDSGAGDAPLPEPETPGDAGGDVEPEPPPNPLTGLLPGHWMKRFLGDCIQEEEWLTFQFPDLLTRTFVDRNACDLEAHGVFPTDGAFEVLDADRLHVSHPAQNGTSVEWTRTFAIVDYLKTDIQGTVEGYIQAKRGLNHMAYSRTGETLEWFRTDESSIAAEDGSFLVTDLLISIRLDVPLDPARSGPTDCAMTVDLFVQVDFSADAPADVGQETFVLPCTFGPVEDGHPKGWHRLAATGFEESLVDGSWSTFFAAQGIWTDYPAHVSNALYDAFRPVLHYRPEDPTRLFHDVSHAWYFEMFSAPPEDVE